MLAATGDEIQRITEYMRSQAPDLTVEFLQKVYTENVMNVRHDIWDVHTSKDRWWVITSPTNLYSQEQFPSMDLALTFHVGLCLRIPRSEKQKLSYIPVESFLECLRNLQEASDALGQAQEVGDYQSVGVRCRESLLAFVAAAQVLVPWSDAGEPPQRANAAERLHRDFPCYRICALPLQDDRFAQNLDGFHRGAERFSLQVFIVSRRGQAQER